MTIDIDSYSMDCPHDIDCVQDEYYRLLNMIDDFDDKPFSNPDGLLQVINELEEWLYDAERFKEMTDAELKKILRKKLGPMSDPAEDYGIGWFDQEVSEGVSIGVENQCGRIVYWLSENNSPYGSLLEIDKTEVQRLIMA